LNLYIRLREGTARVTIDRRTLLALPGGGELIASAHGDQYWLRNGQGACSQISTQRAAALWSRYTDAGEGQQVHSFSLAEITSPGFTVRDLRAGSLSAIVPREPAYGSKSTWQASLLKQLGLGHENIEDAVAADKSTEGHREG
jgi:hypothetical protein